ncbi:MAG TPA: bifunctional methylenetetrahydrofolate dehydrogenase/methenyltetrahydrofolate cyclohydrolase, partial [Methanosarcina sp.]
MSIEGYESRIIDGKALAQQIEEEVKSEVESLKGDRGVTPGLAT